MYTQTLTLLTFAGRTDGGNDDGPSRGQTEGGLERHGELALAVLVAQVLARGPGPDALLERHQRGVDVARLLAALLPVVPGRNRTS